MQCIRAFLQLTTQKKANIINNSASDTEWKYTYHNYSQQMTKIQLTVNKIAIYRNEPDMMTLLRADQSAQDFIFTRFLPLKSQYVYHKMIQIASDAVL